MKWWLLTASGSSGDATFVLFRGVELPLKAMTTILGGGRRQLLCTQLNELTSSSDMGYDTIYLSATSNLDASELMWSVSLSFKFKFIKKFDQDAKHDVPLLDLNYSYLRQAVV